MKRKPLAQSVRTKQISEHRLERFLVRWANLPEIPDLPKDSEGYDDVEYPGLDKLIQEFPEFQLSGGVTITEGQLVLRKAWQSADPRCREWYVFMLRAMYHTEKQPEIPEAPPLMIPSDLDPPPFTPFEQAMVHFQHRLHAALYCQQPGCTTPYFFRRERRDKCCGDRCTNLFRQEYRRTWWQAEGKHRRDAKRGPIAKKRGHTRQEQ